MPSLLNAGSPRICFIFVWFGGLGITHCLLYTWTNVPDGRNIKKTTENGWVAVLSACAH